MVVAAVYGARGGTDKNNFGRNIALQNLFQINVAAGAFVTGSGANLLAAALIGGAIGYLASIALQRTVIGGLRIAQSRLPRTFTDKEAQAYDVQPDPERQPTLLGAPQIQQLKK